MQLVIAEQVGRGAVLSEPFTIQGKNRDDALRNHAAAKGYTMPSRDTATRFLCKNGQQNIYLHIVEPSRGEATEL